MTNTVLNRQPGEVLLGVCGSIAAYKSADLIGMLMRQGMAVQAVLTAAAARIIAPNTLAALSGRPALVEEEQQSGSMPHITLARQAEVILIAPATANTMAKLAMGLADNLLTSLVLASRVPVLVAPAMNPVMYSHPQTQANLARLIQLGYRIIEPATGLVACGEEGQGRLAPLEELVAATQEALLPLDLEGARVLVTAGGTREPLDPVRFVGNRSSGKMGLALAAAARSRGAQVTLVTTTAPEQLRLPNGIEVVTLETANEMYTAVLERFALVDVVLKAAAVADYRPVITSAHKLKKTGDNLVLELSPNPDILAQLGKLKKPGQLLVGFAAETRDLENSARDKLQRKQLDLLVANDVSLPGAGFGSDTNIVTLFWADGQMDALPLLPKRDVAHRILDAVVALRQHQVR